jgi:hypothetical protein
MTIADIFQIVEAVAVLVGVGMAIAGFMRYRRDRNREAAIELLHSFQTPAFAEALLLVFSLPDGLSKGDIESRLGDRLHRVYALMTTWESLGVLVYRREVGLDLVDDFFSGPITISWLKLAGYAREARQQLKRETAHEWFQWLAERLIEREARVPPVPAYRAHADWA